MSVTSHSTFFSSLFHNNLDGIALADFSYLLVDINPALEEISGYKREEVIGKSIFEFIPDQFQTDLKERLERLRSKEAAELGRFQIRHKSGKLKHIETSETIVPFQDMQLFISFIRDVSEKMERNQFLVRQQVFTEAIIESLPGVFYMVDISDAKKPTLVKWNKTFQLETKMSAEELVGKNILDFFSADEGAHILSLIEDLLEGKTEKIETVLNPRMKDGSIQRFYYQNIGLSIDGIPYYLGSGINISDKRDLERKLTESVIETEEAERKRFSADLHDGLGAELSAIKLYIDALMDARDEKSKRSIESKLSNIIDTTFGSLSEISYNISPRILHENGLSNAIVALVEKLRVQDKIKIIYSSDALRRFGISEEMTLYRAISELFNNTLKHANAQIIQLNINIQDDKISVDYSDNGVGFDVGLIVDSDHGNGLRNIKSRIDSLEGTFLIESKKNKGMQVKINIPYNIK